MGFLLFAARKIQLKREINSKNYELVLIANKLQEATKATAEKQQAISDMQANMNAYSSLFNSQLQQKAYSSIGTFNQESMFRYQQASQAATYLSSAVTSVFSNVVNAQNKAELARLQAMEQSLEGRKTSLETQLKQLESEYQSYDEAVKQSAKDAAPQFGLA